MQFLSIPFRNIRRRPLRSTLTALGICIAVSSFIVLVCLSRGLENAWIKSLDERGIHMLALSKEAVEMLTATIDESLADKIRNVKGVSDVSGELVNLVKLQEDISILIRGWPQNSFLWKTLNLIDGNLPKRDEPNGIILGQKLSEVTEVKVGQEIHILNEEFYVTGISKPSGVMNDNAAIFHLDTLQKLLDRKGRVTEFDLRLEHPNDPNTVKEIQSRLSKYFSNLSFIETHEIAENNDILKMFHAMTWATSAVAVGIALLIVLNTLLMSVTERRREIGILSAVGWQPQRIISMIVIEGLLLCVIGSITGFILGVLSLDWLIQLPKLRGLFEPEISLRLLCEVSLATLILGFIGSMYPSLRAVKQTPVEALRYE